jgi:hypothetical protein
VLTVATSISDSCLIIGEGITNNGDKHAFLLTPVSVDGGTWSYVCCQWVWIQEGGGWWWESDCRCYKWHGPPGRHPPCPPRPPHCWWFPLPCCPGCPPQGPPTPTPPTDRHWWCCIDGQVVEITEEEGRNNPRLQIGKNCFGSREEALRSRACRERQLTPTPTPTPPKTDHCWCCIPSRGIAERSIPKVIETTEEDCRNRGGDCYGSKQEADRNCQLTPPPGSPAISAVPGVPEHTPTPTPQLYYTTPIGVIQTPTPTPSRRVSVPLGRLPGWTPTPTKTPQAPSMRYQLSGRPPAPTETPTKIPPVTHVPGAVQTKPAQTRKIPPVTHVPGAVQTKPPPTRKIPPVTHVPGAVQTKPAPTPSKRGMPSGKKPRRTPTPRPIPG